MENTTKTYDYQTVSVKSNTKDLIIDTYENLGFEMTSTGFGTVNFKRDRRIENKRELKEIERKVLKSVARIEKLEASKTNTAMAISLAVGIIGALIMGGGMALVMEMGQLVLGIILGIIGMIVCIPAYFIYVKVSNNKTNKVLPLIEEEYDIISNLCDQAAQLLK